MENFTAPAQATVVIEPLEAEHRNKATTAMILSIVGLALLILPGLNVAGLALSIIGLCIAVKNRKLAVQNGFKECGNNNAAFICGLVGVILHGLLFVIIVLAIVLFLALGTAAISVGAPAISDIITENAPALQDAIESALPAVESAITGFFGLL